MFKKQLLVFLFFAINIYVQAQTNEELATVVQGKVIDKRNREPLPFVTITFKGSRIGTTSDFEGNFKMKINTKVDSIKVSYIGYKTHYQKINYGQTQTIQIEMAEAAAELRAVTVRVGVNPALRIINNARKLKSINNQDNLVAYQYDSYNKVDISLNNISEQMKSNKIFKPIKGLFDTAFQMKNEEGKYILPLFINETFSQYYYNKVPSKNKEVMVASSTTGIGVGDKSFITDLMGTSLQQFNFNENYVRILSKDFISPLSNVCHNYYVYTLLDSTIENGRKNYKIKINLKQEQDLGFLGHMWIQDSTWALTRIDVEISKYANLNFIDRLKLQQEMVQTAAGPFIPYKNRMIIDVAEMTKNTSGIIAKFYNSFSNIEVNKPKPIEFYDRLIERAEESELERDSNFWISKRPEAFTGIEKRMFIMVDSIKNLPAIQTYIDVVRIVVEGYKRIGGIDWGPYVFLYGYNNVEGSRVRFGFKTNHLFSRKWVLKSHIAYGFKDEKFKYGLSADYISNRRDWNIWSISYRDDYDVIGITNDFGPGNNSSNVFQAISIFADGIRLNRTQEFKLGLFKHYSRDWSYRLGALYNTFEPLGNFVFAYKTGEHSDSISNNYTNAQLSAELRWAYKEILIVRGNDRLRLKRSAIPVFTLTYTHGFKGILNSNFEYNRLQLNITHHANTGVLGTADYWLTTGKVWGTLPYPLLDVARGNEVFLYSDFNYSLMNFYEFISDEYAHFTYIQHFEGLILNRIPVVKNWKWRSFAFVKAAYGNLSKQSIDLLPERNTSGKELLKVNAFKDNIPYVEVGYGFENIFRIFSINMVHRLTYLEQKPDAAKVRTWGINLGVRFQF
ncbi:MAG: DUF5686 family protein [Bacteroidota bacterium]